MEIRIGSSVGPTLAQSLGPVIRAIGACAGPQGGACLFADGDAPRRALTAVDIARRVAGAGGAEGAATLILRETLHDADRDLGDGGARLALLLAGLLQEGIRLVTAGVPGPALAEALLALGEQLDAALANIGAEAGDRSSLACVAASAGAPADVAVQIAALIAKTGPDGHAEIVAGGRDRGRIETGTGFVLDAEPMADAFADAAFDPVHLLVADERIEDFGPLIPLLEGFATRGKSLLVVARDVTGTALQTLVRNRRENGLRTAALRPSAVSRHAADVLEDLAIATGATLVADRFGTSVASLRPSMLGRAARFRLVGGRALLEGPAGSRAAIESRRRLLLAEAERQKYLALDRERLERRAARLTGHWGRLSLGRGSTRDTEATLTKASRALASARMAMSGGTAAGGGLALVQAFDRLPRLDDSTGTFAPTLAARRCLAVALASVVHRFAARAPEAVPPRLSLPDGGSLVQALGLAARDDVRDPLPLLRAVSRRAVSAAAAMLRVDAILGS